MRTRTRQQQLEPIMLKETPSGISGDRTVATEKEIMIRVTGANEERLFWLRIDMAREWLHTKHKSEDVTRRVMAQPNFWYWWLRLWAMTDRKILAAMDIKKVDTINWALYVIQLRKESRDRWIPGKVFPAIDVKI